MTVTRFALDKSTPSPVILGTATAGVVTAWLIVAGDLRLVEAIACAVPTLGLVAVLTKWPARHASVPHAMTIGRYELVAKLAEGGMGQIWRARHELLARPVVVKLIRPDLLCREGHPENGSVRALARFELEAQCIASLRSPHTVALYDYGRTDDGIAYYVMELPIDVDVALPASALLRLDRALEAGQLPPGGDRAVTVGLELADGSVYPLKGELRFSEITVDASTGKATLPAVFPNPMGKLLPGMLVRALLDEGTVPDAILVPKPAVTGDGNGGPMTYVVDIEGKLEARKVVIERELGDRWLVTAGLKPGDRVVVEGVKHARPGAPVKAVECKPLPSSRAGEISSAKACSDTTASL